MNRSEAAKKRYEDKLKLNPNYWVEFSKKGGAASGNLPLKDNPERARELARIRWDKAKKKKQDEANKKA